MSDEKNENLRAAYQQLCDSYRAIDDFRTKLLGFLPLATGSGIFLLLGPLSDEKTSHLAKPYTLPVGIFGFVITFGLFCYELYGIKKCDYIIKAGKQIEVWLCTAGQFLNRPREVARYINELFAAGIIYPALLVAWTYLALSFTLPPYALWIAIVVFIGGFAFSFIYNIRLKVQALPANGGRGITEQDQHNMQKVRLMYTGDKAELANIAPGIVWHVPGRNTVCGTYQGFKEYMKLMPTAMEPPARWDFSLDAVMVNGNYVMTTFRLQGKRKDKTIDLRGGDLMRLTDEGKIIEGWGFTENQDALDEFFCA